MITGTFPLTRRDVGILYPVSEERPANQAKVQNTPSFRPSVQLQLGTDVLPGLPVQVP